MRRPLLSIVRRITIQWPWSRQRLHASGLSAACLRTTLLSTAFLLGTPASASAASAPAPLESVTIQLKWLHQFQFAGYYAAQDQGYYRAAGLDVKLLEARPGHDSLQAVLQGEAQYGIGNTALLAARARGLPVVVLASLYQHSAAALLVRRSGAGRPLLEANSRIMLAPNNEELALFLRKRGVPPESLLPVAHNFSYDDLLDGRIDAMSIYTTEAPYILEHSSLGYQILTPRSQGDDFYGDVLYTTESELRDHPRRAAAVRAATLRGWAYAMQHPEQMVDLIRARYPQRHSREHLIYEAQHIVPLLAQDSVELGYSDPQRWQAIASSYIAQGMLPEDFKLDGFLYQPAQQSHWRRQLEWLAPLLVLLLTGGLLWRLRHRLLPAQRSPERDWTEPGALSADPAAPPAHVSPASASLDNARRADAASQQALLDASADALLLLDPDGSVRSANPPAQQLLAEAALAPGQLCWPAVRADGSAYDHSNHPLQLALVNARAVTDALLGLHTAQGRTLWLLANIEPVTDERQVVSALVVSLRPVPAPASATGHASGTGPQCPQV